VLNTPLTKNYKPGDDTMVEMKYCTRCLMPATRPRITFNDEGVCNACQNAENKKKNVNYSERWKQLEELCDKYRSKDGSFDILVPCSGGKDGSTVAWKLKHELRMHPLAITLLPQMPTPIGKQNLENFIKSGFDHIGISVNPQIYTRLAKKGFIEQGRPKLPFVVGISTAIIKAAMMFKISWIMYGEEGESEYGGTSTQANRIKIDRDYLVNCYYDGHDPIEYLDEFTKEDLKWWLLPSWDEMDGGVFLTHWSRFEDWDPYEHYLIAKKYCGFQALPTRSIGTYTNFAQLDDYLQDLHIYLMYLKFGFGRASADASIDIRRGAMDRKQAVALVKAYDGEYLEPLIPEYLEYFGMTKKEFDKVLEKWTNKELFEILEGGRVKPKFEVH